MSGLESNGRGEFSAATQIEIIGGFDPDNFTLEDYLEGLLNGGGDGDGDPFIEGLISVVQAFQAGYASAPAVAPAIERSPRDGLSRRGFLQGLGVSLVALAILDPIAPTDRFADATLPDETVPNRTPTLKAPTAPEVTVDGEHNADKISSMDIFTAAAVSAVFAGIVVGQIASEIPGSPVKVQMGLTSSLIMGGVFTARVLLLKMDAHLPEPTDLSPEDLAEFKEERLASQHAYEHEMAELSNLAVAAALVAASEMTSHIGLHTPTDGEVDGFLTQLLRDAQELKIGEITIGIDQLRAYLNVDKSIIESLAGLEGEELHRRIADDLDRAVAEFKLEGELDRIRSLHKAGTLQIDAEIDAKKQQVSELIMRTAYLAMIVAPFAFTFTSANLANKSGVEIAKVLTELHYLQEIKKHSDGQNSGGVVAIDYDLAFQTAVKTVKFDINSPTGYANLILSTAANTNGALLLGDPPGPFFASKFGLEEYLANTGYGLALSLGATVLFYNAYLLSNVGLVPQKLFKASSGGFLDAVAIIINTSKIPAVLHKIDQVRFPAAFGQGGTELTFHFTEIRENLRQIVGDLLFEDEIGDYTETVKNVVNRLKLRLGVIGSTADQNQALSYLTSLRSALGTEAKADAGGHVDELQENVSLRFAEITKSIGLAQGMDLVIVEGMIESNAQQVHALMQGIAAAVDVDAAVAVVGASPIFAGILHIPAAREEVKRMIENFMHQRNSAHEGHNGASHAAKDVRNALFTQLFAVGSLQTITKKILGLDDPALVMTPQKVQVLIGAVLGSVAAVSSIADNVAAMLFGIDVLEKVSQKAVGNTVYEANPEIGSTARRWAFLMSVLAGSLSKIGNGANMAIELLEAILRNDESDVLNIINEHNRLGRSFANVYSVVQVLAAFGGGYLEINGVLAKYMGEEH